MRRATQVSPKSQSRAGGDLVGHGVRIDVEPQHSNFCGRHAPPANCLHFKKPESFQLIQGAQQVWPGATPCTVKADRPLSLRIVQCEHIAQPERTFGHRRDEHDLEFEPAASSEMMRTAFERQQEFKCVFVRYGELFKIIS